MVSKLILVIIQTVCNILSSPPEVKVENRNVLKISTHFSLWWPPKSTLMWVLTISDFISHTPRTETNHLHGCLPSTALLKQRFHSHSLWSLVCAQANVSNPVFLWPCIPVTLVFLWPCIPVTLYSCDLSVYGTGPWTVWLLLILCHFHFWSCLLELRLFCCLP